MFIDVDALQAGADFVDTIRERLNGCDLMVTIIGRRWTGATDSEGRRRLEQSGDYVRLEVETALERKIATFPGSWSKGRIMPRPEELPIPAPPFGPPSGAQALRLAMGLRHRQADHPTSGAPRPTDGRRGNHGAFEPPRCSRRARARCGCGSVRLA